MAKESIEERELRRLQQQIKGSISATEVKFHKERYEKKKRIREKDKEEKRKAKAKKLKLNPICPRCKTLCPTCKDSKTQTKRKKKVV
jgi:hypothetical protein